MGSCMQALVAATALSLALGAARSLPAQEATLPWLESSRMPGVPFEELARKAGEALAAGQSREATRYYAAGLALNPAWTEGWWRLALLHFDAERFAEARAELAQLVRLEKDSGPSWALLGLSEFKLGDLAQALPDLSRAVALGVPENEPIGREAVHYLALLLVRSGQFAASTKLLERLVQLEPGDPELVTACGLMALRMPKLPSEVMEGEQGLVVATGRAIHAALGYREQEAKQLFQELIARYPTARGVHYVFALFLSRTASSEALPMLKKEVELHPDLFEAQLELAFAILDRGNPTDALEPARAAVRLSPASSPAHLVLGRALVARGALAEGTAELERAARLDPKRSEVYLALAQAYAKAGRSEDVKRARERLIELDAQTKAR